MSLRRRNPSDFFADNVKAARRESRRRRPPARAWPPGRCRSASAWRTAIARGHEVGNHTVNHPCSGNYVWCRNHLEDYTLARMEKELTDAQKSIQAALGVVPTTFAYPCGNKFVGRGQGTQS